MPPLVEVDPRLVLECLASARNGLVFGLAAPRHCNVIKDRYVCHDEDRIEAPIA